MFDNKTYDRLKFVALIVLPSAAAFYLGLSQVWGFPEPEKVGTSIGLLAAFLGALLQISNAKYKNDDSDIAGYINVVGQDSDTGIPHVELTVRKHPEEIVEKDKAVFKVGNPPKPKKDIPEY